MEITQLESLINNWKQICDVAHTNPSICNIHVYDNSNNSYININGLLTINESVLLRKFITHLKPNCYINCEFSV